MKIQTFKIPVRAITQIQVPASAVFLDLQVTNEGFGSRAIEVCCIGDEAATTSRTFEVIRRMKGLPEAELDDSPREFVGVVRLDDKYAPEQYFVFERK